MAVGPLSFSALEQAYAETDVMAAQARALKLSMTPRQIELNYHYSYYAAEQFDGMVVAWDGTRVPKLSERDGIVRQTSIPPGFYDAGRNFDAVPLAYRKPDVANHMVRKIVLKFTTLLFGQRTRPTLLVKDDDEATAWLADMAEQCGLWQRWGVARNLAGAMGAVALTFKFVDGRLDIEVHDTRWCTPVITNHRTGDCSSLEIKYMTEAPHTDPRGRKSMRLFWYRRVIDQQADTTFNMVLVDPEKDPVWTVDPSKTIQHGLGFFPGVWAKNTESPDALDGEPDCKGVYDNVAMMARLLSQSATGAVNNADPTLWMATEDRVANGIVKGSRNAINTTEGGKVGYVEMTGSGIASALTVHDKIREVTAEAVGYVPDDDKKAGAMTAEEVRIRQGAEFSGTEWRREHYSYTAIVPLTERIIRAAVSLSQRETRDPVTGVVTSVTTLSKPLPDSMASGELASKHLDAAGTTVVVKWPPLAPQTSTDAQAAGQAASTAVTAGIMDKESAARFIAPAFNIDDVDAMIERRRAEDLAQSQALESELLAPIVAARPVAVAPAPEVATLPPVPVPVLDMPALAVAPAPAPVPAPQPEAPAPTAVPDPVTLGAPSTPASAAPDEKVADVMLNGAQLASIANLAKDAYAGLLPRVAAIALARIALPNASLELLEIAIPAPPLVPPTPLAEQPMDPVVDPTIPPTAPDQVPA